MRALRLLLPFALALVSGSAAEPPTGLPFETFREQFAAGDAISIEQVWIRGSGPRVGESIRVGEPDGNPDRPSRSGPQIGDNVIVRGRYRLQSRPQAKIGLSLTTRGPSGPTPVSPKASQRINEGDGTFELEYVVRREGELHVTFYPITNGSSFGGVYFRVRR